LVVEGLRKVEKVKKVEATASNFDHVLVQVACGSLNLLNHLNFPQLI
jgi:hypothetical protein